MKRYILSILTILLLVSQGFCQEGQKISIYGEIKSVSNAGNSITVECYDGEGGTQKTVEIERNDNTRVEWELGLDGIKEGYWADIDYVVVNGKKVAKLIIVENKENAGSEEREP